MNISCKEGTDLALPQSADMNRTAMALASDALIMGAGLRQLTGDLREALGLIGEGTEKSSLNSIRVGLEQAEAVLQLLEEAGY